MHILVLAPPSYHRNWKNAFDRLASQHQLYSSVEEALPHAAAIEVILLWKQDRAYTIFQTSKSTTPWEPE